MSSTERLPTEGGSPQENQRWAEEVARMLNEGGY